MNINLQYDAKQIPPRLFIEGELTIFHAGEIKGTALGFLCDSAQLTIDLQRVSDIDGAGVQLLMLINREAGRKGIEVKFENLSRTVADTFELLNLSECFKQSITDFNTEARNIKRHLRLISFRSIFAINPRG